MGGAVRTVLFAAALAALNGLLVLGDFIETPWAWLPAQLSLELVALVALLAWLGRRPRAGWLWALAGLLLAAFVVRLGAIAVPWHFGRDLNLFVDLGFLPVGLGLLRGAVAPTTFVAILGGIAAALVVALVALRLILGAAQRAAVERRWGAAGLVAASLAVAWTITPPRYDLGAWPVAAPVAQTLGHNAVLALEAAGMTGNHLRLIDHAVASRPEPRALPALAGRNVLLIFVESYGAITLTDPAMRAALAPIRARWAERLPAAGYRVASGLLNSPITGGGSWMAHATINFGVRVDNQNLFDVLLNSRARPLGTDMRRAGYRTVAVQPRMQQPWLQAGFFAFDTVLDDAALGYQGPRYSWETTPDQFVLERVHARELAAKDGQPRFLMYVLSSSHAPFDRVPPVVADGRTIGDGAIYGSLPIAHHPPAAGKVFDNPDGYGPAVGYALDVVGRYLAERLDDDSLVIVLGDHQPPLSLAASTRNKAVPVHVLSRDPALVEPFMRWGFVDGVIPAGTETELGMETFLARFLGAFGGGS